MGITTPESTYSSFEFNQDHNYIAVKKTVSDDSDKLIHFGEYTMPAKDVINMVDLGVLKIKKDNDNNTNFSFSPIDEPEKEMNFEAVKAEKMPESPEIDLFCRTWKIMNCTKSEDIGKIILFSNAGTYLVTEINSKSWLSQWRWYGEKKEEFEYSHDNWQHYGRAKIIDLEKNYLKYFDTGYYRNISGYSSANLNYYYELEPITN
jgi:hypothetical protein